MRNNLLKHRCHRLPKTRNTNPTAVIYQHLHQHLHQHLPTVGAFWNHLKPEIFRESIRASPATAAVSGSWLPPSPGCAAAVVTPEVWLLGPGSTWVRKTMKLKSHSNPCSIQPWSHETYSNELCRDTSFCTAWSQTGLNSAKCTCTPQGNQE